jgi:hypothetical protein
MFQFPGFASKPYEFRPRYPRKGGFPHSDIRGSTIARISPRLFAACHVLHRLLAPRHPPNALITLSSRHHRPHAGPNRALRYQRSRNTKRSAHTLHYAYQPIHLHLSKNTRPAATPLAGRQRQTAVLEVRITLGQANPAPRQNRGTLIAPADRRWISTIPVPAPWSRPSPGGLEATGFEPVTPCLQSRCSTS